MLVTVVGIHVPYGQLDGGGVLLLVVGVDDTEVDEEVIGTHVPGPQTSVIDGEHIEDTEPLHVFAIVTMDEQDDDIVPPAQVVVVVELVLVSVLDVG